MSLHKKRYRLQRTVQILDLFLRLFTIFSALLLLLTLLAQYINPNTTTLFALLALGAPFTLILNTVLLIIWTIRWQKIALIPLIVMSIGVWFIGNFVQLRIIANHQIEGTNNKKIIKILSYNTNLMGRHNEFEQICNNILELNPDIICLQEFSIQDSSELKTFAKLTNQYVFKSYSHTDLKIGKSGILTLSKYPLANNIYHPQENQENGFLQSNLIIEKDTTLIINCHLQSTELSPILKNDGTKIFSNLTKIITKLSQNFKLRAIQAEKIAKIRKETNLPIIIVGDMNSPPLTYTYRIVKGNLKDAFVEQGSGTSSTFIPLGGFLRIDNLFFDQNTYNCIEYKSLNWKFSDHKPIYVKLKK